MDIILQNSWLQAALALLPALLVTVIFLFVRKMAKLSYILLTVSVLASFAFCTGTGISQVIQSDSEDNASNSQIVSLPKKSDLETAVYAFLRAEDAESASALVTEYADAYGYDDTCSLMTARIAVYNQHYTAALGIYEKLYGTNLPEEAAAIQKIVAYLRSDYVLADELSESGIDMPALPADESEISVLTSGGAKALIERILADQKAGDDLKEGAEWVIQVNKLYSSYAATGQKDEAALATLTNALTGLSERKLLNKLSVYRIARLKLNLLNGDFDSAIRQMDDYTTCAEYMIALDLYLNGRVEKRLLTKAFDLKEADGINELIRQLQLIREEGEDKLENDELVILDQQIEKLKTYKSDEALYYLEGVLTSEAEDRRNYKSASKIYLSLAKLSDESGNAINRNQYFSDALLTSPSSDDSSYADAMNQLAGTIAGIDGSESVKDIPQYAEQAIQNSYYLKGVGEIIRNPEKEQEQVQAMQDYTVKASAAVTINGIDTDEFNKLVVKVQLSDEFLSERELINLVRLNDCNYEITEYTIEKIDYEKANIILCCDNSGSMSGSISSLKNAVSKFIASSNEKETLGFYTFDSAILQSLPLGSAAPESLQNAVSSMGAFGGTNIFDTLQQILAAAPTADDTNQVIILMTDGQDGKNHSADEITSMIGSTALRKGYIVYVLGMGSNIDTGYLTSIAEATGGQFIYSPSDSELDSLYTFIHGALKNQYKITFFTKDTLTTVDRKLTVSLDGKNVSDTRYYSLNEEDAGSAYLPFDCDVAVYGLRTRLIYKQKNVTDIDITGKGFTAGDSMYIQLLGDRNYALRATYINETTFRISVPADIAVGCYDMEVYLNNRRAIFLNELTVVDGEAVEVKFGGYSFTAYQIDEYDGYINLSGYVTMNDWLHFVGDITLKGSVEDAQMTLVDYVGSYIDYTDSAAATGYAKFLKESGIPQFLLPMGEVTIYNAAASASDYPTAPKTIPNLQLMNLCNYYYPILRLYPDRITLEIDKGDTKLPFQELLLSQTSKSSASPFSFSFNCVGTLSSQNISIKCNIKAQVPDGDSTMLVKLLDTKATIKKTVAQLDFNTLTNEFGFEFNVKIPGLVIDTYLGLGMQWKGIALNGVQFHCDRDVTKTICGIPITFSDFMLGFTGMAETLPDPTYEEVSALALTGSMQIDACKVSAVVPKLKNYVGDASLLSIPDAQFKLRFNHFLLEASASLELLNCVTIAQAEIKLGNFEYSNALLGLSNAETDGVYMSMTAGFQWDKHNLKVQLTGQGEGTINSRFVGVTYKGTAAMELNWWIFEKSAYSDGQALVGFYKDHSDNIQFTIRTSQVTNGKRKGAIFYITSTGKMDYDLNYKY